MNDEHGLEISLSARIGDFKTSMDEAASTATRAFAAIETRGDQTAKKVDASFATVGRSSFTLLAKGIENADKSAVSLVGRLKQAQDTINATKGFALDKFTAGTQTSAAGLLQQVTAAGSLKNFAAISGGALGVGALAAGMIAETTKQLADLQKAADEARTTAAQFAGLQAVFGRLGVASDDTGKMITGFANRLLDAKANGGDLKNALDAAGISFVQADGSLRPTIETLQDVIRAMRSTSDESAKTALATAAFGDQMAGPFVNAVKNGGTALDNLQAATSRAGTAITNDLAAMAQSGMKSLDGLWAHMNQLYSRMKEIGGFSLSGADQINVANQHMREAQGNLAGLQLAEHFRDVDPSEVKAAWQRIFDAGKEVAKANPIPVLPGGDPREKAATPKPIPAPAPIAATGGGSGGGHSTKEDDDNSGDVIAKLREQLALASAEGEARKKIVEQIKIANELKAAGVEADSAEGRMIADLVRQTNAATEAAKQHKEALENVKKALDGIGNSFEGSLESLIVDGAKLSDTFRSLAQNLAKMALQAALMGQGPLGGLTGGVSATSGLGGVFGGLLKLAGFAGGGQISGPGTGTSDSILARVSHGEYIVNAQSARQNLPLLAAINEKRLPKFASGGQVGTTAIPSIATTAPGAGASISVANHVTVNANGGTPAQNADLAKQVSKQLEASMRGTIADEMRRQMRPGNILSR